MSLNLLLRVYHLRISSNVGSVHKLWVRMEGHCSRGSHVGLHRMILLGLLVIFPTVTVVSMPGE